MSPIDDELRTALHRRADVPGLVPSDPLAGIERRARGMRRRRAATAVTGSALAVALVAVGASTFGGSTLVAEPDPGFATRPPATATTSASPAPTAAADPFALDPAAPWAYRGDPLVLENGNLDVVRSEYAVRHPGAEVEPLFGQGYEPGGTSEIVFVARVGDEARWGISQATESGPEFVVDEELATGTRVLAAALPGDEVARLLVVAAPAVGDIAYAGDGTTYTSMAMLQPGVATVALEGDPERDRVRVLDGDGDLDAPVFEGPAPDPAASGATRDGGEGPGTGAAPGNVLTDWPVRGSSTEDPDAIVARAVDAYAASRRANQAGDVQHRRLFVGDDDAGNAFLLAQMWLPGDDVADTVGWVQPAQGEPELQLKSRVAPGVEVVALVVPAAPGQSVETLVVVPRPRTGQVLYGEAASEYRPVGTDQGHLDGVVLVDRRPGVEGDRLRLLDGDGVEFFDGEVSDLLCGVTSCG